MRARSGGGWIAAGTSARTHGQMPTSGPLAEGWSVRSGFSTLGPTSAPSVAGGVGEQVEPVVDQLGVGVEQDGDR